MKEISLNILDVANNSITANASFIHIEININYPKDILTVKIIDNGCGMDEKFLKSVTDPFTTTRKTRKVGLGLPLFKESALLTGGSFDVDSKLGKGTTVKAVYKLTSIDRMPLGDIGETIMLLIGAKDSIRYKLDFCIDDEKFTFDTDEVIKIIGTDVSLAEPEILTFIKEYINNGINELIGGREII